MKNIKLTKVEFAGAEVLTRERLKKVMGGGSLAGQCGTFPNCLNGQECVATSGDCIGRAGTCGTTSINQTCTCAVIC